MAGRCFRALFRGVEPGDPDAEYADAGAQLFAEALRTIRDYDTNTFQRAGGYAL